MFPFIGGFLGSMPDTEFQSEIYAGRYWEIMVIATSILPLTPLSVIWSWNR